MVENSMVERLRRKIKPCYSGWMVKHYPLQNPILQGKLTTVARQMRHEPTPAEDLLWQRLRGRQLSGHRFHRQFAIDRFIVDFVCLKSALIVEVDGGIHQQQKEADQEREEALKENGFRVIRFSNAQVLEQTDQVLLQILAALS